MKAFSAVLCVLTLALSSPVTLGADVKRIEVLRQLMDYWAKQASSFAGWLGAGSDPGYVPVAPPDSSLWAPGTLLLLSETNGLQQIGSREKLAPTCGLRALGKDRSDIAVLKSFVFGSGKEDQLKLQDLPGILEAFGIVRTQPTSLIEDLQAAFGRYGVHRVTMSLPDAQVHRLLSSDLKTCLEEDASEGTRHLLANSQARLITAAVFLKTIQLRFDVDTVDPGLIKVLESIFGVRLKSPGDGSLELDSRGLYVAIQTAHYTPQAGISRPGGEAKEVSLTESTGETRDALTRLIGRLQSSSTTP